MGAPLAFLIGLVGLFTDRPRRWALGALLVSGPFVALMLWAVFGRSGR